jgi:hypothetical protein
MTEDQIRGMLDRLGHALSSGDPKAVASCWQVPALVLSDEGVEAVATMEEIVRFFAGAIEWYHSRGLSATRPEVDRIDRVSEKLSAVDVRWRAFDAAGKEHASEHSHYILRLGDDGQPRIRVALTRRP